MKFSPSVCSQETKRPPASYKWGRGPASKRPKWGGAPLTRGQMPFFLGGLLPHLEEGTLPSWEAS